MPLVTSFIVEFEEAVCNRSLPYAWQEKLEIFITLFLGGFMTAAEEQSSHQSFDFKIQFGIVRWPSFIQGPRNSDKLLGINFIPLVTGYI